MSAHRGELGVTYHIATSPQRQDDNADLQALVDKVRRYQPDADLSLVTKAFFFARTAHIGQKRDSGEAFLNHPYQVACILAELELDPVTMAAGLLHDVIEDTSVTRESMEAEFGSEITRLVDGVTKLSRIPFQTKEEHQAQSLRKMFLSMAEDLRVVLIKLADRLHNLRTLEALTSERQKKIARETLEIYTPLTHRLGMWSIKWEMEDQAFRYLEPEAFRDLATRISSKRKEREVEIEEVMRTLRTRLGDVDVDFVDLQGRPKNLYSIYQKMQNRKCDLSEIYDLMAVRIITKTVKDCYGALGLVHSLWKPVPGRFKDYIAMPKSNLYQSLHTTIIGPGGEPVEIQIRTIEMHRIAERGIAAHWLYKEGHAEKKFEEKVAWLRQLMEWLREVKDPEDILETLKIDLFEDEVFVFTPKGDVKNLPAGSTPVDFAFSVHTDVGMRCIGAKVNGRIVPLDHQLANGEFVEILTSKVTAPRQDWLTFVKTSKARSKIRSFIKEQRREEAIERGKEMLEKELRKFGCEPKEVLRSERVQETCHRYRFDNIDDMFSGLGFGAVTLSQLLVGLLGRSVYEQLRAQLRLKERQKTRKTRPQRGILVHGEEDMLVRIARCCSPVPGDHILGYITRGRGVSIHRADCPNALDLQKEPDRQIEVEWDTNECGLFPVEIEIEALDRVNLLTNVMTTVSEGRINISSVQARTVKGHIAIVHLVVDIDDISQMQTVMQRIRQVNGVLHVRRAQPS